MFRHTHLSIWYVVHMHTTYGTYRMKNLRAIVARNACTTFVEHKLHAFTHLGTYRTYAYMKLINLRTKGWAVLHILVRVPIPFVSVAKVIDLPSISAASYDMYTYIQVRACVHIHVS